MSIWKIQFKVRSKPILFYKNKIHLKNLLQPQFFLPQTNLFFNNWKQISIQPDLFNKTTNMAFAFVAFCCLVALILTCFLLFLSIWQVIASDELKTDHGNNVDHQNETDFVKLVENKPLMLDELCRDSETPMFVKSCQKVTLKRFQGNG